MGHKVSSIHGVKSENYHKQGNAINEVWLGNVELISRLPFGDSDLAQAAWPVGGWPKIPWHNFIIPWKRSIDVTSLVHDLSQKSLRIGGVNEIGRARTRPTEEGHEIGIGKSGPQLPYAAHLVITTAALSLLVSIAFYFPVLLRATAPRLAGSDQVGERGVDRAKVKKRVYATRALIATGSHLLGLAVAIMGFYVLGRNGGRWNWLLVATLDLLWALATTLGFFCSANATGSIWMDWQMARKRAILGWDETCHPEPLLGEQLPMDVMARLERGHNP